MKTSLVVTVIGSNMPGLVSRLSEVAARHGANWLGARMANLAGQFAGVVHLEILTAGAESLAIALRGLESTGLRVLVTLGSDSSTDVRTDLLRLELVGQDQPGIVRDISQVLADRGVSIEDLVTLRTSGAFSGDDMFRATALLRVPETVARAELRAALEALASTLMVDLSLDESTSR